MYQVVTVHRILPQEIAEAQEYLHALSGAEHVDVFAPALLSWHGDTNPAPGLAEDDAYPRNGYERDGTSRYQDSRDSQISALPWRITARGENTSKN